MDHDPENIKGVETEEGSKKAMIFNHHAEPFPHAISDNYIGDYLYREALRDFPKIESRRDQGRTGYDIYRDDYEYADLLRSSPAWKHLHSFFCSESFVKWSLSLFPEHLPKFTNPRFRDFVETRAMLFEQERLPRGKPGKLFVRMDIQSAKVGYKKLVHVDHDRRVVSMLLYFCDQAECGMSGGELVLHDGDKMPVKTIAPRHNRAIVWPQVRDSWHSVNEIVRAEKPRQFLYVTVSSRVSVWPKAESQLQQQA